MPTLTSAQLTTLASYLDTDYDHSDIVGYYTYLASLGVDYGDFAKAVVQNSTAEGKIANAYAASVALDNGVDLSVGGDDWKQAVFNIATRDLVHRTDKSGADLSFEDYDAIHTEAFDLIHLPAETWTAHTPLTNAEHLDPLVAEATWNSLVDGSTSSIALLSGGLQLSLSALAIDPAQSPVDFLRDNAAAAKWLANIAVAMYVAGDTAVGDLIPTTNTQFWTDYNNLKGFFADEFGANTPVAPNWMDGYLDPGVDPTFKLPSDITSGIQAAFASAISASSPLVIDLSSSHTGVTLTAWGATTTETFFDLNDTGFAVQTAWVSGDTGLLARDLDSNGTIDSSAELFGSPTVDGFAKLAVLDSNHDLRIDNNDDAWNSLVVWQDANGDAVTESGELHSLSSLGIASIDLAGVASSTSTISGNQISHTSTVTFTSGATAAVDDAWFVHDNTNSYYTGDYTLDVDTLFLPQMRGYGTVPNLAIAMSEDTTLKGLVADYVSSVQTDGFACSTLDSDFEGILYRWASVDSLSPDSRGVNFDARKLGVLEHILGEQFLQLGISPDPGPGSAYQLELAWHATLQFFKAQMLLEAGGDASAVFDNQATYDPATGDFAGGTSLSEDGIIALGDHAPAPGSDNVAYWVNVVYYLDQVKGIGNVTGTEAGWLDDAVSASDASLSWSDVVDLALNSALLADTTPTNYIYATSTDASLSGTSDNDRMYGYSGQAITIHGNDGNDTITGSAAADTLYGDLGRDTLYGGDENDQLHGGNNNDILWGESGDDVLDGGAGGNFLYGGFDDDTYVYTGGDDYIDEQDHGGTDVITMNAGVTLSDLSFARVQSNQFGDYLDLLIRVSDGGSIQIFNQLDSANTGYHIETIVFSDSTTLDLSTVNPPDAYLADGGASIAWTSSASINIHGGSGNDTISTYWNSSTTIIDGGAGNDTISTGSGDDTIIASPGFDTISDAGGSDTIVIPESYSLSDVTLFHVGTSYDLTLNIAQLGEIQIGNQLLYSSNAIETLHFLSGDSYVTLTDLSVTNIGTSGSDSISAPYANAGPNNIFDGREGDDYITGSSGNDTYILSAGHDTVWESGGDDTIKARDHYSPEDVTLAFVQGAYYNDNQLCIADSDGNTLTIYNDTGSTDSRVEHVAFGDSTVWNLASMEIETHGTSGDDSYLSGHDVGDASSNDTVYGYAGNDNISGGNGDDLLYGGDGNDTIYADIGYDVAHGDSGADQMTGTEHAILYGDDGDDILYNGSSSVGASLVTLHGGDGADALHGGYGGTVMEGDSGADTLYGWSGGVDTFRFDGATAFDAVDTIQQFNTTDGDKLDISDILEAHYDPVAQALTDFVQIQTNGSNSEVYVDTSGSATFGAAQHIATLQGVTGLTDEDALVTAGTLIAA